MEILILVVFLTLSISALCSLFEATLYSTRMSTLEVARNEDRHRRAAKRFIRMKHDISTPTSAILILNTVANTAGAALAGMFAAQALGVSAVPAFSLVLTVAILFLSEILPKTLGATRWKLIWPYIVLPLDGIQKILKPAIWTTRKFSHLLTGGPEIPTVTEDEVRATILLGARSGELSAWELRLLNAVFHFDELLCRHVMVPRQEVVFLEPGWSLARCVETARKAKHTRYPVCRASLDQAIGLVHIKDLIGIGLDQPFELETILRPIRYVPETAPISQVLHEMQKTHQHMALVLDEYGTAAGIITLEIVLEQIVGSLQDEFDSERPEMVREADDRYVVLGHLPLSRINRELKLELAETKIDTLSGLLMSRLGRLLRSGDRIALPGAEAEVLEVQPGRGTRIRLHLEKGILTDEGGGDRAGKQGSGTGEG
jgi:CBS domain containing-hemolysin-like protein